MSQKNYEIISNIAEVNGRTGGVTSYLPPANLAEQPSGKYTNWWTEDPNSELSEGQHIGANIVSRWLGVIPERLFRMHETM